MKRLFTMISLIPLLFACSCSSSYMISGHIEGLKQETLYVTYRIIESCQKEVSGEIIIPAPDGNFRIKLPQDTFAYVRITPLSEVFFHEGNACFIPKNKTIELIRQKREKLTINGILKEDEICYNISNSELNKRLNSFRECYYPLFKTEEALSREFYPMLYRQQPLKANYDSIRLQLSKLPFTLQQLENTFIQTHPNDDIAAFLLMNQPIDSMLSIYNTLGDSVKQGKLKPLLNRHLIIYEEHLKKIALILRKN